LDCLSSPYIFRGASNFFLEKKAGTKNFGHFLFLFLFFIVILTFILKPVVFIIQEMKRVSFIETLQN